MSFVRFVFTILIAGMVVNLTIVLLANSYSQRQQARQVSVEKQKLAEIFSRVDKRVRRMDIIVESQHVGAHDVATDSTLLVRQYQSTGTDQSLPLPVERIVIPGDRVQVGGLMLEFSPLFSAEDDVYQILGDKQLVYFGVVCGASEKKPEAPLPDERFTFIPRESVPNLTRVDFTALRPSYFEIRFWKDLWEIIPDPDLNAALPWTSGWTTKGIKATWIKPADRVLRRGHTYTAYVGADGLVTLDEDKVPSISGLLDIMLEEGRKLRLDEIAP